MRGRILSFFDCAPNTYHVIFTANATAAAKLVAECFDWQSPTCVSEHLKKVVHIFVNVHVNTSADANIGMHHRHHAPRQRNYSLIGYFACCLLYIYIYICVCVCVCQPEECAHFAPSFAYLDSNHTSVLGMRQ
jgi:hypothetical protein